MKKDAFIIPLLGALLWFGNYQYLLKALGRFDQNYWLDCYIGAIGIAFYLRHAINLGREFNHINPPDKAFGRFKNYIKAGIIALKDIGIWFLVLVLLLGQG